MGRWAASPFGTSRHTKLSKETYEQVVVRWNELGFSGKPPVQTVFEDSAPGTTVE